MVLLRSSEALFGSSATRLGPRVLGILPAKNISISVTHTRSQQRCPHSIVTVARAQKGTVLEEDSPRQQQAAEILEKQWQKQQEPQPDPSSSSPKDPLAEVASPALFLGASLGFMLTTFEIFHPNSTGTLLSIDAAVHQFALGLPVDFRYFWANVILSESLIGLGVVGWLCCATAAVASKRQDTLVTMLVCAGMYLWGAGFPSPPCPEFLTGPFEFDAHICNSLKDVFERVRPSPMLSSYSYPSGHTSSVTFIVGTMLFILLPSILDKSKLAPGEKPKELLPRIAMAVEGSYSLWISAAVITVIGRCCADAHWFSDCVGGGCLSVATVSGTAMLVRALVQPLQEAQEADKPAK